MRSPSSRATIPTWALVAFLSLLLVVIPVGCGLGTSPANSPTGSSPTAQDPSSSSSLFGALKNALLKGAVEEACAHAATALEDRDPGVWRRALPVADDAAGLRDRLDDVYAHIAPLEVTDAAVHGEPIPGRPACFNLTFTGRIGAHGPDDRLLAERLLLVRLVAGDTGPALRVTADVTPEQIRGRYLMGFHKPRLLTAPHLVIVYEQGWHERARSLLGPAARARRHVVGRYGVGEVAAASAGGGREIALFVYGRREHVESAFAATTEQIDERIRFFSHAVMQRGGDPWSPADVGVVAAALDGDEERTATMLRHEITHAYTVEWFLDTVHAPVFLLEGLAVTAEGRHDWSALRSALAAGDLEPGLADAIAQGDIWSGRETDEVRLQYEAAGSLVEYILTVWEVDDLRAWMRGVADSDLGADAIATQTRRHLGVDWVTLQAGWHGHVKRIP